MNFFEKSFVNFNTLGGVNKTIMKEKILILGGTEFVGRQLVNVLSKDDSKTVYLFNRGKTNPDLFPDIPKIVGDRETDDIEKINAQDWDYVIDFSSFYPASLQRTINQLKRSVKKYIYISTISVYDFANYTRGEKINEAFEKITCSPEEAVDTTMRTYGKKKQACEQVLEQADWLHSILIRPSIIYGKFDPTDRFYYWCRKIKMGGEIIIPNKGENKLTLTYAEDLVAILLKALNEDLPKGAYNCGTHEPLSFLAMLNLIKETLGSSCTFYGIDRQQLRAEKIGLPISGLGDIIVDSNKIKQTSGLKFISFEDSIKTMIAHFESLSWPACKTGLSDEEEKALLLKFKTKT